MLSRVSGHCQGKEEDPAGGGTGQDVAARHARDGKPEQDASFQPPKETKKVGVDPANPEHQVISGNNMDIK